MNDFYRWENDKLLLQVYLKPNANQNEIVGVYGDYLKIKIKSPPVDNQANELLIKLLADAFGVTQKQVSLIHGKQNRQKFVAIESPKKLITNISTNNKV